MHGFRTAVSDVFFHIPLTPPMLHAQSVRQSDHSAGARASEAPGRVVSDTRGPATYSSIRLAHYAISLSPAGKRNNNLRRLPLVIRRNVCE